MSFDGASRYLSTARLLLPEVEIFLASRLVSFQRTCIIPAELQAVSSLNDSALWQGLNFLTPCSRALLFCASLKCVCILDLIPQSPDGTRMYLCSDDEVRTFCPNTGSTLNVKFIGHEAEITAIAFDPTHSRRLTLLTSSQDCTLRSWDALNGTQLKVFTAPGSILSMIAPAGKSLQGLDTIYFSCWQRKSNIHRTEGGRILAFSMSKFNISDHLAKTGIPPKLVGSPLGNLVGAFERHSINVWSLEYKEGLGSRTRHIVRLHHSKPITVIAFSESEDTLAAGDTTGRITLWRGFSKPSSAHINWPCRSNFPSHFADRKLSDKNIAGDGVGSVGKGKLFESSLSCSALHWHAASVTCLSFASDGAHLLSGGFESVLVIWQLNEDRRSYIPQIGAPLNFILQFPGDFTRVAVGCADNSVRIISLATLTTEVKIVGIRPAALCTQHVTSYPIISTVSTVNSNSVKVLSSGPQFAELVVASKAVSVFERRPFPSISFHPDSRTICFATMGTQIQLYKYTDEHESATLHVAPQNVVNGAGGSDDPPEQYISVAEFNTDGSVLATIDRRYDMKSTNANSGRHGDQHNGEEALSLETLRIWEWHRSEVESDKVDKIVRALEGEFVCVSTFESPHAKSVTSLQIRGVLNKGSLMACSVSLDGVVKIWIPSCQAYGARSLGSKSWICRSTVAHQGFPSPALLTVNFSQDESLLATSGMHIVLWDPDTGNELQSVLLPTLKARKSREFANCVQTVLNNSQNQFEITGLTFITNQPLIVGASSTGVVIWSLLNFSVYRVVALPCTHVAAHTLSSSCCVAVIPSTMLHSSLCPQHSLEMTPTKSFQTSGSSSIISSGCLLAQFIGRDAAPGQGWATLSGTPEALLYSKDAKNGMVVITNKRKVICPYSSFDINTGNELIHGSSLTVSNSDIIPKESSVAARLYGNFFKSIQGGTYTVSRGIPSVSEQSLDLGELAKVPSHALPSLTNITPSAMTDHMLPRRRI